MALKSILKKLVKVAPVIIANAPAIVAAARQVSQAMKTPKPKA